MYHIQYKRATGTLQKERSSENRGREFTDDGLVHREGREDDPIGRIQKGTGERRDRVNDGLKQWTDL